MKFDLQIETVPSDVSVEEFNKLYFIPQKPVVIKGLAKNTTAGHTWSLKHFKSTMGDVTVDIFDNGKKNNGSAYTKPDIKMRFGDYLEVLEKNEKTNLRIFLFNLFKFNPQLRKEFPCPPIFKGILDGMGFMFFGGKDTTVRIHQDLDMSNVLLTQFQGKKRVVLISPDYSTLLYRLPFNTYSLIDLDKPDYQKYPGLNYVRGYDFVLEDGDTLFMPTAWWHYMTYLESGFAVSYRKIAHTIKQKIKGIVCVFLYTPFDKLMNKVEGKKWLEYKEYLAELRANRVITAINKKNDDEERNYKQEEVKETEYATVELEN